MDYMPICFEHNKPISFLDINSGTPLQKRALCSHCDLNKPIPVDIALNQKKQKAEGEQDKYIKFFNSFLIPLQEKIKSLPTLKHEFDRIIEKIDDDLKNERDRIKNEMEQILHTLQLNDSSLTISSLQKIGEELSQQSFSSFEQDKIKYQKQFLNIQNGKQLTLLSNIQNIIGEIQQEYEKKEFLINLEKCRIKFNSFQNKKLEKDCYASAINSNQTLLVVSHNIELLLFEIRSDGVNQIDSIQDFGFFFEVVFDKNNENLIYLADYNSYLRVVKIENNKLVKLNASVEFKHSVSCVICNKNSEVIVASQEPSFKSYILENEEFKLIQDIGTDSEISSITLNYDENLMATSHTNYIINIWEKKDNQWSTQQDKATKREDFQLRSTLQKPRKDRNAVCFLKHNILAYLSDTGILRLYKQDNDGKYQNFREFQYSMDKSPHFPSMYSLRFNYFTKLLACHQYNNLSVYRQNEDGEIEVFQEFPNITNQVVGCSLSNSFLVAQESQNAILHILKLGFNK